MQSRRRRRFLVGLAAASALLGLGANPGARAQEAPAGQTGDQLFGNYDLIGHAQGVKVGYAIEGLLPGGAPVLDLGLPETYARFGSGPTGYGVASLAYPGGIIVNLPSLVAVSGGGESVPPYPIKAEAFYPSGPVETDESQPGGTTQKVVSGELGVDALATFPATDAPPAVKMGSVTTHVRTSIEESSAVTRSRIVANDVAILGGLITFDSVITDLAAVHNGTAGSTEGSTTATGVRFMGLDSRLTDNGLIVDEAPPVEGPGGPLGCLLCPVVPGLEPVLSPVQQALVDAFDQARPNIDPVLAMAGVRVVLAEPTESTTESGASARESAGVLVEMSYKGREQAALVDLINAIPPEAKPDLGPIANPVNFLAENHIETIGIAPASVSVLATPPFPISDFPVPDASGGVPGTFDPGTVVGGDPAFATPLPEIAPSDGTSGLGSTDDIADTLTNALPALLVMGALVVAPLFGVGSTKLADNVLAPVSSRCPTGLDRSPRPPPPARLP